MKLRSNQYNQSELPVAVIGAGPIGLAAAAHLREHGLSPLIFERGSTAGATVAEWAHVRVFSPWVFNVDTAARRLLEDSGWRKPDPEHLPTGAELVRDYLAPLAAHPAIASCLALNAEVLAVTRQGRSRLVSEGRETAPFVVLWRDTEAKRHRTLVRAVIDASGTWVTPNPIRLDGLPVDGEVENADLISHGIPDVLETEREVFRGRHSLLIGAGHSAINAALDLVELQNQMPETRITWATRSGGTVRPHGVEELIQPEKDVYIVGMKSYGRAPTFLLATVDEQVRSVVAELAGDPVAARDVRLALPETGICGIRPAAGAESGSAVTGCCGGAPLLAIGACCVADEKARSQGQSGCGCSGWSTAPAQAGPGA